MEYYSADINRLVEELAALPGIGKKSAERMAFHIINLPHDRVKRLSESIISAKEKARYCAECCTLTDAEYCPICADQKRDQETQRSKGDGVFRASGEKRGCKRAHAHEAGMSETEFTENADGQVQGNGQNDISAERNQKSLQQVA